MPASPIALRHHIIKNKPTVLPITCYYYVPYHYTAQQHPGFTLCYTGLQSLFKEIDEATLTKSDDILQRTGYKVRPLSSYMGLSNR